MRPLFKDFTFKDWIYLATLVLGGVTTITMIYGNALAERQANHRYSKENRKLIYEKTDALKELIDAKTDALKTLIKDIKNETKHNRRILYDILKRVK